jgi:uracil-DNA glycosylase family protein
MEAGMVLMDQAAQLEQVKSNACACRLCPLWETGTQTVFGMGPVTARLMLIGEAPGAQEDATGVPFAGPAGRIFDEALQEAGIDRATVYVTNTVKHRPWVASGTRKKNRPPKQGEIRACAGWLDAELEIVQPVLLCCLGAVAAKRMLGKDFKLTQQRGLWFEHDLGFQVLATVHPSFVLIQPADSRERWWETLVGDLRLVRDRLQSLD